MIVVTAGTVLTAHLRLTETWSSPELWASGGLLAFNTLLAVAMLRRSAPDFLGGALGYGLFLVSIKLFVNTFTILVFIGLQAMSTAVFVPVFFAGYFVLLVSTIWALHRTTNPGE